MKIYAINGSPRKNKNTATLLDQALEGAKSAFPNELVETERINLYDLNFTGCRSCFACKVKDGKSYGKCAVKDDLFDVLEKLSSADGIIIGSPIYYRTITGQLHAFLERWLFQYMTYKEGYPTIAPKRMNTACIYSMNVMQDEMLAGGYRDNLAMFEMFIESYFKKPLVLEAYNTVQFDDYSRYVCETFNQKDKTEYKEIHFEDDCQKAFEIGQQMMLQ